MLSSLISDYSIEYLDDFQDISIEVSYVGVYGTGVALFWNWTLVSLFLFKGFLIKNWSHMDIIDKKDTSLKNPNMTTWGFAAGFIFSYYQQSHCSVKRIKNIHMCLMDADLWPSFYHMSAVG